MSSQSRFDLACAIRSRVLHSSTDFLLSARVLSKYGAACQPYCTRLQEWLLLLPPHLLPTEKRHFWDCQRPFQRRATETGNWQCTQKHLWDAEIWSWGIGQARVCWKAVFAKFERSRTPVCEVQYGVIPTTVEEVSVYEAVVWVRIVWNSECNGNVRCSKCKISFRDKTRQKDSSVARIET